MNYFKTLLLSFSIILFLFSKLIGQEIDSVEIRLALDNARVLSQKEIFSNVNYTILNDKNVIKTPIALIVTKNNIILSNKENIYFFDLNGLFKSKTEISRKYGKEIINMRKDQHQNLLVYLKDEGFVVLNDSGKILEKRMLSKHLIDSIRIDNKDILMNLPRRNKDFISVIQNETSEVNFPYVLDGKGNYPMRVSNRLGFFGPFKDNRYLVSSMFMTDIIEITDNKFTNFRLIFPEKNTINPQAMDFSDVNLMLNFFRENKNYIINYRNLIKTDNTIIFSPSSVQNYSYYYMYNLKSKDLIRLRENSIKDDELPVISIYGNSPLYYDSNSEIFYTLIYSEDLFNNNSNKSMIKKIRANKNPTLVSFKINE